jgi:hypothetical protein
MTLNPPQKSSNPILAYLCAFHRLFGRLFRGQRSAAQLRLDRGVRALQRVQISTQCIGFGAVLGGGDGGLDARDGRREGEMRDEMGERERREE